MAGKGRCIDQRSARRAIDPSISSLSLEPDASDSKPSSSVQRAIANRWFQYSALLFRCRQSHQPRQVGGPWAHGVLSLSSRISLMIFFSSSLGVPEPRFEGTAARVGIPSDTQEKKREGNKAWNLPSSNYFCTCNTLSGCAMPSGERAVLTSLVEEDGIRHPVPAWRVGRVISSMHHTPCTQS